ncbi:MAG: AAA family ATPase [Chloroflexota bacterium]|nr:MAG: AAA family ATPase [Chloroflexota bacterium]
MTIEHLGVDVSQRLITDDLSALLGVLPPSIRPAIDTIDHIEGLLEIVLDLGRRPEARLPGREILLSDRDVTAEDIEHVVARVGEFGDDNRAGLERTLHRVSAIRNRKGSVVGLTLRVGRAVYGTIAIIQDIVESGKSMLLLGRPGVGKTTMLREVARVLADEFTKRVIIVDTSNEIAGDGDIPHPGIGRARRMQVPTPTLQHGVMIEAVENHMPEVIVIDEIGTELEAVAARTIAERGVQLVGTAHGNTLENLMLNPTLSDLIGGIHTVTLSDEEARRRGTQKSVLERMAPPTFDVIVEIQNWERVAVHLDVSATVDALLRNVARPAQTRWIENGELHSADAPARLVPMPDRGARPRPEPPAETVDTNAGIPPVVTFGSARHQRRTLRVYPYGVSLSRLEQVIQELRVPCELTKDPKSADVVMTLRNFYRRKPPAIRDAEAAGIQIFILKSNSNAQIQQSIRDLYELGDEGDPVSVAIQETEDAISAVLTRSEPIELAPRNAYIRRLQHQLAERYNLASRSEGREPYRRVKIYP